MRPRPATGAWPGGLASGTVPRTSQELASSLPSASMRPCLALLPLLLT